MTQTKQPATNQPAMPRRKLLGAAGTTGALAVAATLFARRDEQSVAPAGPETKPAPERGGGYRVTDHVLHYYRTTKV